MAAEALAEEHANVRLMVKRLAQAAAGGDIQASKTLALWTTQGYGAPQERVEVSQPTSIADLDGMSEAELVALVARGRERRLQQQGLEPAPDVQDWRRRDAKLGVVEDVVDGS